MIFQETLDRLQPEVDLAVDELFKVILNNQKHEQDLLLVIINGFYIDSLKSDTSKLSPYVFGTGGWNALADSTMRQFFLEFIGVIETTSRDEYFSDFMNNTEKQRTYNFILQIELMLYLKFFESERTLKILFHLSNLSQGKNYDWHYIIPDNKKSWAIIINDARNPIKDISPKYYNLLKDIYISQIRNAVAHSQFYINNETLGFTNFSQDAAKYSPLSQMQFKVWEELFHKLVLFIEGLYVRLGREHDRYINEQLDKEYGLQISIPDSKIRPSDKRSFIKFIQERRADWMWYVNWEENYKYKKMDVSK